MEAEFFAELSEVLTWADEFAQLKVYANADTPRDAQRARRYGAMGIGLCRTERMFNDADRLPIVQEMILAETPEQRKNALDRLLPIQRADFKNIFKAMEGHPVTVRLLDPPIHEFLPTAAQLEFEISHLRNLKRAVRSMDELPETLKLLDNELHQQYIASLDGLQASIKKYRDTRRDEDLLAKKEVMLKKVFMLSEVNPMLGHRGVRLGITYPEIYSMQIQAILEATAECMKEGVDVSPGDHGSAGMHGGGVEAGAWSGGHLSRRRREALRRQAQIQVRQHGGGGSRLHARRAAGGGGGVLLLRHQRPDPGHVLVLARGRREQVPADVQRDRHPAATTRSRCST